MGECVCCFYAFWISVFRFSGIDGLPSICVMDPVLVHLRCMCCSSVDFLFVMMVWDDVGCVGGVIRGFPLCDLGFPFV